MIALAFIAALTMPQAVADTCARWHSETQPPHTIRVLVGHKVERVPFALWTARVVSSEWGSTPPELRKAGAVATKQYGWYKAMHPRRSRYGCFDVHSNTRDAIYRHHKTPPERVWQAVHATWHWRVLRNGHLFQTGWRRGLGGVGCARDVTGYHLKARSAARCALAGYGAAWLLRTYYGKVKVTK